MRLPTRRLDVAATRCTVIEKNFAGVPTDVTRKILHDNAAALYRIAV